MLDGCLARTANGAGPQDQITLSSCGPYTSGYIVAKKINISVWACKRRAEPPSKTMMMFVKRRFPRGGDLRDKYPLPRAPLTSAERASLTVRASLTYGRCGDTQHGAARTVLPSSLRAEPLSLRADGQGGKWRTTERSFGAHATGYRSLGRRRQVIAIAEGSGGPRGRDTGRSVPGGSAKLVGGARNCGSPRRIAAKAAFRRLARGRRECWHSAQALAGRLAFVARLGLGARGNGDARPVARAMRGRADGQRVTVVERPVAQCRGPITPR